VGPDVLERDGSQLLVATGRTPNTDSLNVSAAGISTDGHGFIQVNGRLETSQSGIFALGDIKGGPAFTHIAYDDFRILRTNLISAERAGDTLTIFCSVNELHCEHEPSVRVHFREVLVVGLELDTVGPERH
jgi:pyruvate/2-oxoglutarate dehydrogenase complex dihydrolipoamide dehydrogenase (E3) component